MIYKALRYEIEQSIPEFKGEIYPTNAPKSKNKPYLVYYKTSSRKLRTLDGFECSRALSYIFSIMSERYEDVTTLMQRVEVLLASMSGSMIGKNKSDFVEEVIIDNVVESYEKDLGVHRGIVDFTMFFRSGESGII